MLKNTIKFGLFMLLFIACSQSSSKQTSQPIGLPQESIDELIMAEKDMNNNYMLIEKIRNMILIETI